MKTISDELDQHINTEVTTLATCWRVERIDGITLGFTTLDTDIEYNGVLYEADNGFQRTAIATNSDMSVDNLDVTGVIDSDRIDNNDLRNGLYDFARVYMFLLNYEDIAAGELSLRTGRFGEVSLTQSGGFTTELRGLNQTLSHSSIEVYTPECRADFCDKRCKLKAEDFTTRGVVADATGERDYFKATALKDVPDNTSVGAHRVWGIKLLSVLDPKHGGFAEVRFYDQALQDVGGRKVSASSEDKNHGAGKARDGNPNTNWSTANDDAGAIPGQYWIMEFDNPVDVREVALTATANFEESPSRFALIYGDRDDGEVLTLTEAAQFTMTWTAGGQSAVWGIGQTGSTPLTNNTGSPVPAPYKGASTYEGGLVTFRSGLNAGKAMEITAVDGQWVKLFDNLNYPIRMGDTFEIMQGCNKDKSTCKLYDNIINFRGEPHVPGQDAFLTYPDASAG